MPWLQSSTESPRPAVATRRAWSAPVVADLPALADLTLVSGAPEIGLNPCFIGGDFRTSFGPLGPIGPICPIDIFE